MATDLENMLIRLTEMQKAVMPNSDAVPVSFYVQESTPYWKNHLDSITIELESEALQRITYRITMTLVLANLTEGYEQEAEKQVQTWTPVVLQYFGQRRQLKRTSADTPVTNLDPLGALITSAKVDYIVQSGIGQTMIAVDFTIDVPMVQDTNPLIF